MESDPENRPRPRRWLRWLSIIGLLMAVLVWLYFRDEALEPADDLLPQRPSAAGVPDEENGWVQWQKVCDSLPEIPKEEQKRLKQVISLELPADQERDTRLALDDDTVLKLEAALKLPVWKGPDASTDVDRARIPKLGSAVLQINLKQFRALQAGDKTEVLRLSEILARLRRLMAAGNTSFSDFITGMSSTQSRLPWLLAQVDFTEAELEKLASGLEADPCTTEELHEVLRHAHQRSRARILSLTAAELEWPQKNLGFAYSKFFFQKHATANHLARRTRAELSITLEDSFAVIDQIHSGADERNWMSWANPNRTGEWFANMEMTVPVHSRVWSSTAEHRCVRVLVALHRYWKATGALPDDLSVMVPRFLADVPRDPFDLKPLRWDKTKRVVHSVGRRMPYPPNFTMNGRHSPAGWLKLVDYEQLYGLGVGVRFRRPEEGPDVPVKQSP